MADRITIVSHTAGLPPGLRAGLSTPAAGAKATRPQVPVGWVRLEPEDLPDLAVLCELGDDAPDLDSGYGGFATARRTGDEALTWWEGTDGVTVTLELILDGTATGTPVDALYDNLEAMAGRGRKRLPGQPPKLIVDTAGLFRSDTSVFPDQRWGLNALTWSKDPDDQETDPDGHRMLAVATATLLKLVEPERLQTRALKARLKHQAKTGTGKKTYTLKDDETLITVAAKKLGDPGRWPELARLNGIRDPLAVKANAVIRLP